MPENEILFEDAEFSLFVRNDVETARGREIRAALDEELAELASRLETRFPELHVLHRPAC